MGMISDALALAVEHHQAGRLQEAEQIYRQVLAVDPNQTDALHLLGVLASQAGDQELAVQCIRRAIELTGSQAAAHGNLGNALKALGRLDEAVESYRRAVGLQPDDAGALYNLGTALQDQEQLDEAIACFRRALELRPDLAEAHNNLGKAFQAQENLDEAVAAHRRALELKPELAEACNNLGTALLGQKNTEEAVACFRRCLELKPDYAEANCNLGDALRLQGKLDDAVACCRRALELKPNYAEAHGNLANALQDQGKLEEAVASYRRALELKPNDAGIFSNLGNALRTQGRLDDAVGCFRRAIERKPDYAEAHSNLGTALKDQGRLDEAVASFRKALKVRPSLVAADSNLVYTLYYCPNYDAAAIYHEHCRWNRQHAEPLAESLRPCSNDANPARWLKVGYVSPDFRDHCQAFFTAPLFSSHDHEQFEIFCYSDVKRPDAITERLRSYADVWRNIKGLSDEQAAALIRQDEIDILVDLSMHMADGRPLVFARKPAPVQLCWFAYPGTTGISAIDYRITDRHLDPPGQFDQYYSEQSIRLSDSFWCYDPLASEPGVNSLPAIERGCITFGSLNNFCKVNAMVVRLWASVLCAVEGSQMVILAEEGSHREWVLELFEQHDVSRERIRFVGRQPRQAYLEEYHRIDIGLDTIPWNGHTTSLDSYWMGVPVVTIVGQTVVGRAGVSQLTNLGLPELIAHTPDGFTAIAAGLASNLPRLSQVRMTLRERLRGSALMDAPRFARNMEAAYRDAWKRWCAAGSTSFTG